MRFAAALISAILLLPAFAFAFPFGGQASQVVPCYNQAIYANLGPPRGGPYIWTFSTKTYQFGPPSFAGQWLLGLATAPYYCLVSIDPIITYPGIAIDMMGSSGSAAGTINQLLNTPPPTLSQGGVPVSVFNPNNPNNAGNGNVPTQPITANTGVGTPGAGSTAIGHVVISEVFANVDPAHGSSPLNQWVELYNGTTATIDLSGWALQSSSKQSVLPGGSTLPSGQFMVVIGDSSTPSEWSIPLNAKVVSVNGLIDGGLSTTSDSLSLKNASGLVLDALSWGSNTTALDPAISPAPQGNSLQRITLSEDTNTSSDWINIATPSPGE